MITCPSVMVFFARSVDIDHAPAGNGVISQAAIRADFKKMA
jgi:hypothetical protein